MNTNIPLMVQGFKPKSSVDAYSKAYGLKQMMNQGQLQDLKMQEYQQGIQDKSKIREIMSGAYDPESGSLDRKSAIKGLYGAGMYEPAMAMEQNQSEIAKAQLEAQKTGLEITDLELEQADKQIGLISKLASSATDQQSYEAALSRAQEAGIDTSNMPREYDPQRVRQIQMQALDVKDKLSHEMENRKLMETMRHNRVTEQPTSVREYNKAVDQGYQGTFEQFNKEQKEAGATTVSVGDGSLTPGVEAVDKQFAKDVYTPYVLGGGSSDAQKNLQQLKYARDALEKSDNLTGPIIGMQPDFYQAFKNPKALDVREAVEEVVQRNLREVLGAQFTEKEGERLIARAYNPKLSEEKNKQRLDRLMDQLEKGYEAKRNAVEYFEENGTLKGFRGKLPSINDFYSAIDAEPAQESDDEDILKKADEIIGVQ